VPKVPGKATRLTARALGNLLRRGGKLPLERASGNLGRDLLALGLEPRLLGAGADYKVWRVGKYVLKQPHRRGQGRLTRRMVELFGALAKAPEFRRYRHLVPAAGDAGHGILWQRFVSGTLGEKLEARGLTVTTGKAMERLHDAAYKALERRGLLQKVCLDVHGGNLVYGRNRRLKAWIDPFAFFKR